MIKTWKNPKFKAEIRAHFLDVLDDIDGDEKTAIIIMQAFEEAIIACMDYHENQVQNYRDLHRRFLLADVK